MLWFIFTTLRCISRLVGLSCSLVSLFAWLEIIWRRQIGRCFLLRRCVLLLQAWIGYEAWVGCLLFSACWLELQCWNLYNALVDRLLTFEAIDFVVGRMML